MKCAFIIVLICLVQNTYGSQPKETRREIAQISASVQETIREYNLVAKSRLKEAGTMVICGGDDFQQILNGLDFKYRVTSMAAAGGVNVSAGVAGAAFCASIEAK